MIVEIVIIVILSNWSAESMYMYIVTEGVYRENHRYATSR